MYNSVFNRLLCTQDRGLVPEAGGGAGFERARQARDPGVTQGQPDHPQAIGSQLPGCRGLAKDPQNHTVLSMTVVQCG